MAPLRLAAAATVVIAGFAGLSMAHDGHWDPDTPNTGDWGTDHMHSEHHITNFDPGSFFALHDFDGSGIWEADEIRSTYGLNHESNDHVPEEKKKEVVYKILELFNPDGGEYKAGVTAEQFEAAYAAGKKLPDFGYGPGHHGDDEYEYEIHHFEIYHDENSTEEDLIHEEDIEHFKKHEQMWDEENKQAMMDQMPIVAANIPAKFRRGA